MIMWASLAQPPRSPIHLTSPHTPPLPLVARPDNASAGTDKATRVPYDSIVSAPASGSSPRTGEISAERRPSGLHDHVRSGLATCSRSGAGVRLDEPVDLHWPVTLVCWDNGFRSSLGRLGAGPAPKVERVTRHARSRQPTLRRTMPRPAEGIGISTADVPEKQVTEHAPEPAEEPEKRPPGHVRETVVIIVLSVTAVLAAWCGFESSKWSGEMSIAFSQASSSGSRPRDRTVSPMPPARPT